MKIRELKKLMNDTSFLKMTDLENIFNVYVDKNNNYIFNLNSSLYFSFNRALLDNYTCTFNMHWPLISYKLYGTTRLAWLLYKLNDVSTKDIFKILHAGDVIKYIDKEKLENIINTITETNQ